MIEEWREVPGLDGWYDVSNLGRVRSWINGPGGSHRRKEPKVLKPSTDKGGYKAVTLRVSAGRHKTLSVHGLVLKTFIGTRPEGMQGCHDDGNPSNNRLDNLRWDTLPGNQADRKKHGTDNYAVGELQPLAKLTDEDARWIRSVYVQRDSEFGGGALARRFGVTRTAICNVVNRKTWRHV